MVDTVLALSIVIATVIVARWVWNTNPSQGPKRPVIVGICAVACAATSVLVLTHLFEQPGSLWNAARLAPAVSLHYGFHLYYPRDTGPVLSTVVGPVAFLFYWPIGLIRSSPSVLILTASLTNVAAFALLGLAVVRRASIDPLSRLCGLFIGAQLVLLQPSLQYSVFGVHADAPALILALLSLEILSGGRPVAARGLLAALALWLGLWAKQSLAPLIAATVIWVWWRDGRRTALRWSVALALVGACLSVLMLLFLDASTLYQNSLFVPAHHPWHQIDLVTGEILPGQMATAGLGQVKVLFAMIVLILKTNWSLVAVLCLAAVRHLVGCADPQERKRRPPPWMLYGLVAGFNLPTAALGRVKVGGDINHESFFVLFLISAFLLWFLQSFGSKDGRSSQLALLSVLLVVGSPRLLWYQGWQAVLKNPNEAAYRYSLSHPGRAYFPWSPLSVLLAEHRLYHFDYGVFDRNLGELTVTSEHLVSALPEPFPTIAVPDGRRSYIRERYFPGYQEIDTVPALEGWHLWEAPK